MSESGAHAANYTLDVIVAEVAPGDVQLLDAAKGGKKTLSTAYSKRPRWAEAAAVIWRRGTLTRNGPGAGRQHVAQSGSREARAAAQVELQQVWILGQRAEQETGQ